jgi:hypothetical protein
MKGIVSEIALPDDSSPLSMVCDEIPLIFTIEFSPAILLPVRIFLVFTYYIYLFPSRRYIR